MTDGHKLENNVYKDYLEERKIFVIVYERISRKANLRLDLVFLVSTSESSNVVNLLRHGPFL